MKASAAAYTTDVFKRRLKSHFLSEMATLGHNPSLSTWRLLVPAIRGYLDNEGEVTSQ